jgi:hypothetical protein
MYLFFYFSRDNFKTLLNMFNFSFLTVRFLLFGGTENGKHYVELFRREVKYELFSQQQGETFITCKSFQTTRVCHVSSIYHYNL